MIGLLLDYRYLIWLVGGLLTYWLLVNIPSWQRVARSGTWGAERDYAAWRVKRALLALLVLIPLLLVTTASAFDLF